MTAQQKKKVLMLAVCHPDAIGGQAACARMLLENLHDVEWTAISFPLPKQYGFLMRFFASIKILIQSLWVCMTRKIDAVHLLTACGRSALFEKLVIARALKLTGVKVVINFQGAFDVYYHGFSKREQRFVETSLRKLDVILCLHSGIEKFLLENDIVPGEKIKIIPNAVPVEAPTGKMKGDADHSRLLYLGWIVTNKGLFTLVEAMSVLMNKFHTENISLEIIGPEVEQGLIKKLAGKAKQEKTDHLISFHAPVFGEEKNEKFAAADIFVFPTRMEGFPFVLLEAMQAGMAVVTTDISPMNLVVEHGINGLLFEKDNPADFAKQIHALVSDPEKRARLGQAARQTVVTHYSIEKIISMYSKLYAGI